MSAHLTKEMVGYDEMGGMSSRRCGNCINFIYPNTCELVKGGIESDGVCSEFDPSYGKNASVREIAMTSFAESMKEKTALNVDDLISLIRQWMDSKMIQEPLKKLEEANNLREEKRQLGEALLQRIRSASIMYRAR